MTRPALRERRRPGYFSPRKMAASSPPAGISPASAFSITLEGLPLAPPVIVADAIGTGGEFVSLTESATIADGMVIEALSVHRGTGAAVRELGQRFRFLEHVTDDAAAIIESMTRQALAPAIEAGVVELVSAVVEVDAADPAQLNLAVEFRDRLAPPAAPVRRLTFPLAQP